jgi:thiamine-phosphate pyrophosphorylase
LSFSLPRIYPITDTLLSGLSHPEQVQRFMDGGSRFIQIREKNASSSDFYRYALEAMAAAKNANARLIINDRVDIALAVGAAGVHLGQDDLPAAEARQILGAKAIIGVSTHSVKQAIAAARLPIDYIAFGPVFSTSTKARPDPVTGLEALKRVRAANGKMPLVAIGGINIQNIASVISYGADSAAIVGALFESPVRIPERYRELDQMAKKVKHL